MGVIILAIIFRPVPQENQSAIINSTVISIDSSSYDFGTISMAKGDVAHEFKIKNTSEERVEIKKVYTSCMCTSAWFLKGETNKGPFGMQGHGYVPPVNEFLEPNEEAIIRVVFDPAAHGPAGVGSISRVVYVEGSSSRLAELNFSANVKP